MATQKNYILQPEVAEKKLRRMALEIIEENTDEPGIILAGIRESGLVVARTIQKMIAEFSPVPVQLISLSLDKKHPGVVTLSETPDLKEKVVIVVDDVSNSGRTLLYALKPFLEHYPKKIQTLVLVERTHTYFPVRPDYVGLSIATTIQENIVVEVEGEKVMGAFLE